MAVSVFTPSALIELYFLLNDEQRQEFLRLLGQRETADSFLLVLDQLKEQEKFQIQQHAIKKIADKLIPMAAANAIRIAKMHPNLDDEALLERVTSSLTKSHKEQTESITKLEKEKLKAQRDRKSDPEIVKRNLEIINLRKPGPNRLSQAAVARKYKISDRAVRKIEEQKDKWQKLASEIDRSSRTDSK